MKARSQPSLAKAIRALRSHAKSKAAPRPAAAVPVLIAYADVPSARHALGHVTGQLRQMVPRAELQPMLWRFNQLDDPRWREMALRDASRATSLVLAMPDESAFCARTETWMNALLSRMRGTSLSVLALIGEREAWTITLAQPTTVTRRAKEFRRNATEVFASVAPKAMTACAA